MAVGKDRGAGAPIDPEIVKSCTECQHTKTPSENADFGGGEGEIYALHCSCGRGDPQLIVKGLHFSCCPHRARGCIDGDSILCERGIPLSLNIALRNLGANEWIVSHTGT